MKDYLKIQIKQFSEEGWTIIIRKINALCMILLALPLMFIVRILRPLILIRFGDLMSDRIGHLAQNTELYLCEIEAGIRKKGLFDIFFMTKPIANQQLKKMVERMAEFRVWNFAYWINRVGNWLPGWQEHIVFTPSRDINNLFDKIKPHSSFTEEEEIRGVEEKRKIGLPDNADYICFFARDSAYLNRTFNSRNWDYHNYRDCNINNYLSAADEMTKRGYYMVRMGAVVKSPLNTNNPMIIDYATKGRTDFLDVYLSAKCKIFLSCGAGIDAIPMIFRKPTVFVNFMPLFYIHSWSSNDLTIPKKLWLRKEKRFLIFREIISSDTGEFLRSEQYEEQGIDVIENSPEEIMAITVEMDDRIKGTWKSTPEDEELQQQFWDIMKSGKNFKSTHGIIKSRIGAGFLRQNKNLLK